MNITCKFDVEIDLDVKDDVMFTSIIDDLRYLLSNVTKDLSEKNESDKFIIKAFKMYTK